MALPRQLQSQFQPQADYADTGADVLDKPLVSIEEYEQDMSLFSACLDSLNESLHIVSDALTAGNCTRPMATSLQMERQARNYMMDQMAIR